MKIQAQTAYQQLGRFFPALTRSDRVIDQFSDSLGIWLRESADRSTLDSFQIEFSRPPAELPLGLFGIIRNWLPQEVPPIESLIAELTDDGQAKPFTRKSKKFTDWLITVSVFHQTFSVRFDYVA